MSIDSIPVSSFMSTRLITETADQNISSASRKMHQNNIGSIVIVDNDSDVIPVGIITERDIVRIVGELKPWLMSAPLSTVMSKPLITIYSNASIRDSIQTMYSKNIRRLPVISSEQKENQIVGIITDKDIFRVIMKNQNLLKRLFMDDAFTQNIQPIHEQFAQYMFGDILIHKK
jgi:CBS domain-containing protein